MMIIPSFFYLVCIKYIKVGFVKISLSSSVRNLGKLFDSRLDVSEHITKLFASAFFYIYYIRRIRKYLSKDSADRCHLEMLTAEVNFSNSK